MTKMQFQGAAARVQQEVETEVAEGESAPPSILEFSLAGQDFQLNMPTTTQVILLSTSSDEGTLRAMLAASMAFLEGIMIGNSYRRFRKLVAQGVITNDLLLGGDDSNDQGIVDWIISQMSDNTPTPSSTDSAQSPASTGPKSTGRARGQGSISSDSP